MKTKTIISIACMAILIAALILSSNPNKEYATHLAVADDLTDTLLAHPDYDRIISLYPLAGNESQEATFRLQPITDMNYVPASTITLEGVNTWLSYGFRKDSIDSWKLKIKEALRQEAQLPVGRGHSAIYRPLVVELTQLQQLGGRRIMLAYSDMMENTDTLSFYNPQTLAALQNNSDSIKSILEKEAPLGNLEGVEIYIIYQPDTYEKNKNFTLVADFYKRWFESHKATVHIQANL